jgi:cell division septal protein FtsQ
VSRTPGSLRRGLPPAAAGIPVPADKRFRRSDVRPGRRRNWRRLLGRTVWFGGGAAIALALVVWAGSALLDASGLKVDHLVVRGTTPLSAADVDTCLKDVRGASVLRVDLEQVRLHLLESPWVASAELWRVLPSTVQVRIIERTPLAVARLHGQFFLVDAGGFIIDSFGPRYRQFDLPVVDGLMTDSPAGAVVSPEGIRLVQRLFREVSAREDLFRRMSQVDVSNPRNAVVLIDGEPAQLQLGDRQFLERLQCWMEMASSVRAQRPVTDYVNLRLGCSVLFAK